MKANFKIDKSVSDTEAQNSTQSEDLTEAEFEEFLRTLTPGWNLWSIRSKQ